MQNDIKTTKTQNNPQKTAKKALKRCRTDRKGDAEQPRTHKLTKKSIKMTTEMQNKVR